MCDCKIAKNVYMGVARLLPKEDMQLIAIQCRVCEQIWFGVPEED